LDGSLIALGDEKGGVKVIGWSADDNDWKTKYENAALLNGAVNDLSWTDDNKIIVAVGAGGTRAAAVDIEKKSSVGELKGHNATLLCSSVKNPKPYKLIVSGEDKEIQIYKGVPFKLEKSIQKSHTGFVTNCGYTPWDAGARFITVSQDKSLKVYDGESFETLSEKAGLHSMGINDFAFGEDGHIITCSSDRSVKMWKINEKTLDE